MRNVRYDMDLPRTRDIVRGLGRVAQGHGMGGYQGQPVVSGADERDRRLWNV